MQDISNNSDLLLFPLKAAIVVPRHVATVEVGGSNGAFYQAL